MSKTHVLDQDHAHGARQAQVGDTIRFSLNEADGGRYSWKVSNALPFAIFTVVPGLTHDGPEITTNFDGFTFLEGSLSDDLDACVLRCETPGKYALSLHYTAGSDRTNSSSGYDLYLYVSVLP
jgi:hypothetical protein